MAPGRTVPWCCWDEWCMVKNWLLSPSAADIRKGIQRVEAWRARGRVPLGVDITASLLETALCDASFWGGPAATAAPFKSAGSSNWLSQQQIRLQYSATIVRFVNGIADSQQKGRVALSVNSLAEAAGLSRLLVDIRHESTHNELPSLPTLQLAARQALDWLVSQYWQRQSDHLQACHSRVTDILSAITASCHAAAAKGSAAAAADDDDEDDGAEEQEQAGYQGSEGRKQRKQLLSELKTLLPPAHTPLLAALLLQGHTLLLLPDLQQQQGELVRDSTARKAQQTALTSLSKQYPELRQHLLQEVIDRLCNMQSQQQKQKQQQEQESSEGDQLLLSWLRLLLPINVAAEAVSNAKPGKPKQQQQQQRQQQQGASVSTNLLTQLLADVIHASRVASAAAADSEQQQQRVVHLLLDAQQMLLAALARTPPAAAAAAGGGNAGGAVSMLQKLAMLATPRQSSSSSAAAAAAGSSRAAEVNGNQCQQHALWLQQQQTLLTHSQQQQQRKRKLAGDAQQQQQQQQQQQSSSASAAPAGGSSSSSKRWQRAKQWTSCPIGCLPQARQPRQLLEALQGNPEPAASHNAAAAAGGAGGRGADPTVNDEPAAAAAAAGAFGVMPDNALEQQQQQVLMEQTLAAAVEQHAGDTPKSSSPTAAAGAAGAAEHDTAIDADPVAGNEGGSNSDCMVRLGRSWQISKSELGRLQQEIKLLL